MVELEAMVRIIERAENTPDRLKDYVLAAVERAVLDGTGPTRCGGTIEPGCITAAECALIRRTIFAAGGESPAAVSQREAEMLYRLKDATLDAPNAPEIYCDENQRSTAARRKSELRMPRCGLSWPVE